MKRSIWFVLFIFCISALMAGCSCFPCGKVAEEAPPPAAVVTPAPAPAPAPVPPPPLKQDRN